MTVGELRRAASWLYHNDIENKLRFEIYDILEKHGLHNKTPITVKIESSILEIIDKYKTEDKLIQQEKDRIKKWRKKRK